MDVPFIWTRQLNRFAVGGADVDIVVNMPTLPLSGVLITLDYQVAAANTTDIISNLLQAIRILNFRYRGTTIWSLRGDDLLRVSRALVGSRSQVERTAYTAAVRRLVTLWLPFGYSLGHPTMCFPKVEKGSTELVLSMATAPTGYNTGRVTVDVLQLPNASPSSFFRCTTIADTPAATGNKDYDLPRSGPILGCGIVVTNSEPGSALADIEDAKILAQFQDYGYSLIGANAMRALQYASDGPGLDGIEFGVLSNIAGAYTQFALTGSPVTLNSVLSNFSYLNCDWQQDQQYAIDGRKFNDLKLRLNFNTAAACRILPVEYWTPSNLTGLPSQSG